MDGIPISSLKKKGELQGCKKKESKGAGQGAEGNFQGPSQYLLLIRIPYRFYQRLDYLLISGHNILYQLQDCSKCSFKKNIIH